MNFLKKNYEDISDSLKEIEREYFAKRHHELSEKIEQGYQFYTMPKEEEIEQLPGEWLEVVSDLGENWFSLARRLYKARNKAAHSYDSAAIAKAFGIAGPQPVDLIRAECLKLLKKLLGITLNAISPGMSGEEAFP